MEKNRYARLLDAQKEIKAIKKEQENPFFHSKYFDINALIAEVKPILNKHGLIVVQPLTAGHGKNHVVTQILDSVTDMVVADSSIALPEMTDPQKMGGAITYYRRYALQSLLCLEADDDDGNTAAGNAVKPAKPKPTREGFEREL